MKPVIGITMNPDTRGDDRIGRIYSAYLDAARAAGLAPVLLFDDTDEAQTLAARLDGLLLSGGDDVDPARFGQPNLGSRDIDAARDAQEFALLQAFRAAGKPVLGICRGIQVISAALGGTLVQDIPSQLGIPHPFGSRHPITVEQGSFLYAILGEQAEVNSTHHQAVGALPPGFRVAATAPDGVIEAIEDASGAPVYGVQFHPERLFRDDARMVALFRLLNAGHR